MEDHGREVGDNWARCGGCDELMHIDLLTHGEDGGLCAGCAEEEAEHGWSRQSWCLNCQRLGEDGRCGVSGNLMVEKGRVLLTVDGCDDCKLKSRVEVE